MAEPTRSIEHDLLAINQRLLDAIDGRDWAVYSDLCDPSLTAFEPEAQEIKGNQRGQDSLFSLPSAKTQINES